MMMFRITLTLLAFIFLVTFATGSAADASVEHVRHHRQRRQHQKRRDEPVPAEAEKGEEKDAKEETKDGAQAQDGGDTADDADKEAEEEADEAEAEAEHISDAEAAARDAKAAAATARVAAAVANKVAAHSATVTRRVKSALKKAHEALHSARMDADGLTAAQHKKLEEAEDHLEEAAKAASYGRLKRVTIPEVGPVVNKTALHELQEMREELCSLREELRQVRRQSRDEESPKDLKELEDEIKELEEMLASLEHEEALKKNSVSLASHAKLQEEIDHLAEAVHQFRKKAVWKAGHVEYDVPAKKGSKKEPPSEEKVGEEPHGHAKGHIDIDTNMPFSELEPFGREDTAQELTEASVKESNSMVDQIERAEIAEEKRAIFRALTRLRGTAITSFDGVARAQTGNIDQYAKDNVWRASHPVRHLADEESDVSKWAFPADADF